MTTEAQTYRKSSVAEDRTVFGSLAVFRLNSFIHFHPFCPVKQILPITCLHFMWGYQMNCGILHCLSFRKVKWMVCGYKMHWKGTESEIQPIYTSSLCGCWKNPFHRKTKVRSIVRKCIDAEGPFSAYDSDHAQIPKALQMRQSIRRLSAIYLYKPEYRSHGVILSFYNLDTLILSEFSLFQIVFISFNASLKRLYVSFSK